MLCGASPPQCHTRLLALRPDLTRAVLVPVHPRYVYHPLDKLYVVLITNKHSNIMEDLSMLQLLTKLIPDLCGSTSYDVVQANVFQVLFAFDEVITSGGYKEDITLRQVRQNMEMNSHDERLALLIRQSKINEANVRRAGGVGRGRH